MRIPKREIDRERDRDRDRDIETERERQTDRQTDTETERQRDRERCLLVYIDIVAKGYNPLMRSVFFDYFL